MAKSVDAALGTGSVEDHAELNVTSNRRKNKVQAPKTSRRADGVIGSGREEFAEHGNGARPNITPARRELDAGTQAGMLAVHQRKRAIGARQEWEATPAGKQRMTSPVKPIGGESMAGAYRRRGFKDDAVHSLGQRELPGMEHPDAVPNTRWEDMPSQARQKTLAGAAKFGVTPESAHRAFGAQLDQAHHRAAEHGAEPHAMRFYSGSSPHQEGAETVHTPRSRLIASAKENNVSLSTQVVANAITSPKQVFERVAKSGPYQGQRIYPNDMNATAAIEHVQAGKPWQTAKAAPGAGGMHGNSARAAYAADQKLKGTPTKDLTNPSGSSVFGPKTGAYHNAWIDPHGSSQFLTSDIHTGGGGFAPHLPVGAKANPGKSREDYLAVPGVHAFHDHIARQVMKERNLHSLSGAQAAQWGEERLNRGLESPTSAFAGQKKAKSAKPPVHPGQGSLF